MTDSRPDQDDDRRAEQDAPAWHSFGVPYGGAPEPPPYTPAMRERPQGDLTQRIDTSSTQEVHPETRPEESRPEESRPWWTTPGDGGAESSTTRAPTPARSLLPTPTGDPYAAPWATYPTAPSDLGAPPGGAPPLGPGGPHTAALPAGSPRADRRGRSWMPIAAIALVAALIGGAVVLGGQQLLNRTGTLGSSVPAPGPGSTAS